MKKITPKKKRVYTRLIALLIVVGIVGALGIQQLTTTHAASFSRSGLPWLSGMGTNSWQDFESFRGRPTDVWDTWDQASDWGGIESLWDVPQYSGYGGLMSIVIPPFPDPDDGSGPKLSECSTGADNSHYTTIAKGLKNAGWGGTAAKPTFIRYGHEASGNWYKWGVANDRNGSVSQAEGYYVNCWKNAYNAFKAVSPYFMFDFNVGSAGPNMADMYPGDGYVDIVSTDWYDEHSDFSSQCNQGTPTRPVGPCQFAAFARAHGKKISVPEWGLNDNQDNPSFIANMANFFRSNADIMTYEAYYNLWGCKFQISDGCNPNSAAEYKKYFGAAAVGGTPTAPTTPTTPTTPATPTAPATTKVTIPFRMVAGRTDYTDSNGNKWVSDSAYTSGDDVDAQGTGKITGTSYPQLYENERWGNPHLGYTVPVANGTYTLNLHFAETSPNITASGQRVFSGTAEGKTLFSNLDIFREVGADKPDDKSYTVTVTDGVLDISLDSTADAAKLSALELTAVSQTTTPLTADINGDGHVNTLDLSAVLTHDGTNYAAADLNKDGTVGAADLAILLSHWTW